MVIAKSKIMVFTNHCGVIDYKGHSYFFIIIKDFRRRRIHRSIAVEEFSYNSDGSFPVIRMSNDGPEQLEALDPYNEMKLKRFAFQLVLRQKVVLMADECSYIENGDYIASGVDFGTERKALLQRHLQQMVGK